MKTSSITDKFLEEVQKKHLRFEKLLLKLHLSEFSLKQHTKMPDAVLRK